MVLSPPLTRQPKNLLTFAPHHPFRLPSSYLPKLLAGVLAAHALQDLRAARVLVDEAAQAVHVAVDDDVQPVLDRVVRGDVFGREDLRHLAGVVCGDLCLESLAVYRGRVGGWGMRKEGGIGELDSDGGSCGVRRAKEEVNRWSLFPGLILWSAVDWSVRLWREWARCRG